MIDAAARTHAGRVRTNNEDAFVCLPERGLFGVIDGMGGEAAGEIAAAIAARALSEVPDTLGLASETLLVSAIKTARQRILEEGDKNPTHRELGAVATAVRLEDDGRHFAVAHVGDTRAWLVTRAGPTRLTQDHLAAGAGKRPVARDLGRRDLEGNWVDTRRVACAPGDLLVLCSDGLSDVVPDEELAPLLTRLHQEKASADAVTAKLLGAALSRGGPDNVTVIAARMSPFRRGQKSPRSRLWVVPMLGVLGLVAAGLAVVVWRAQAPAELPATLGGSGVESSLRIWDLPDGATLSVHDGGAWTVGGARLQGTNWTVSVGAGASLTLDLVAVDLTGVLSIQLGEGARLQLFDSRLSAPFVYISGPPSAQVELVASDVVVGRPDGFANTTNLSADAQSRVPSPPAPDPAPETAPVPAPNRPAPRNEAPR